jgi:transposase
MIVTVMTVTGAPAYDPAVLLKIILYAYSRGITSSRKIEQCCRENIIFMALSADTQPHFTTIADFISTLDSEIVKLFLEVLLVCDEMHLIGKEMFAIDGVKLPSNASKEWSGTKEELSKKKEKMEQVIRTIMTRHRGNGRTEHPRTRRAVGRHPHPAGKEDTHLAQRQRRQAGQNGQAYKEQHHRQ